jgi:hypothetical protein
MQKKISHPFYPGSTSPSEKDPYELKISQNKAFEEGR